MGVAQGGTLTRGPIVPKEFLEEGHTLNNYLLMSHLTLRISLMDQALHLIGIKGKGLQRKIYIENIGSPNLLHLMVR